MTRAAQVPDDPTLLQAMLEDLRNAPEPFRPTNYRSVYEKRFISELHKHGLRDYRRRRNSVLASFGATDPAPLGASVDLSRSRLLGNRLTRYLPGWSRLLARVSDFLNRPGYAPVAFDLYDCTLEDVQRTAFRLTQLYGEKTGARPLEALECSLAGNPEDVIEVDGKTYTMRGLFHYLRYAYCCQFIDFERAKLVVELGSGSGKQIEVIRKLHPHLSFLAFDIGPQLYVCEQFLTSVFPGSVVSYRETRRFAAPDFEGLRSIPKGTIFILGTEKFPFLEQAPVHVFWNAASFQEMEPEVVANYLQYVNVSAGAVFLQQRMHGKKEVPQRKGMHGVLKQTTLDDYRRGLSNFELVDRSPCLRPLGTLHGHEDSFWRRARR